VVTRPEDGGSMFLQNNVQYLFNYREDHHTKILIIKVSLIFLKKITSFALFHTILM